jgi:hypothetical protein
MVDRKRRLSLMRYWLFGVFILIFTAMTIYLGGVWGLGIYIFAQPRYWMAMGGTASLTILTYYLYKRFLLK